MISQLNRDAALKEAGYLETPPLAENRYYTADQLADLWKVSPRMIERIFMDYPQVIKVDTVHRGVQRIALKIPEGLAKLVSQQA